MVGEVARMLGVSDQRVRQLDDILKPDRTATGVRLYDPARIEKVAAKRAARKTEEETHG